MDVVRVAEGFSVAGKIVKSPHVLTDALKRGLNARRPYLLNVTVDPAVARMLGWPPTGLRSRR